MSIENAILEHASAIRELAAAIKSAYQGGATISAISAVGALTDTELEAAVTKVETATKPTTAKEAVKQALEAAKANKAKEAPAAPVVEETDPLDDGAGEPLDWDKDVKPVLGKITDKAKLVALLGEFGAKNGGELKAMADKFPAVLAAAKKVLGE